MDFCLLLKVQVKKNGKNINKNLRCKYSQKLDHAKQSATDAFKTASKRAIPKAVEATGDKTAVKILKFLKIYKKIIQKQL